MKPSLQQIKADLRKLASPAKTKILSGFFKTGPGEYGEGDVFIGVTVPQNRAVVKKYFEALSLTETIQLLCSAIHEERLAALLILVQKFQNGSAETQKKIYDLYLGNAKFINNWDLVDSSAEHVVGAYLLNRSKNILFKLADSKNLWERRIAIVATFHFIKRGQPQWTFQLAKQLLQDPEDLIHKATGWMLREAGKRCSVPELETFLKRYAPTMPRTMLRYAIEKFPQVKRLYYLKIKTAH